MNNDSNTHRITPTPFSFDEARRTVEYSNTDRREPSLETLHGLLLALQHRLNSHSNHDELHGPLTAFFTTKRIHTILQSVVSGQADDDVRAVIQNQLNTFVSRFSCTWGGMWLHYTAWFKCRMIDCLDLTSHPDDPFLMKAFRQIPLDSLPPIRETLASESTRKR